MLTSKAHDSKVKWDQYFKDMAELVARKSKDKFTKIGAVIVGPDNEVRSTGYNSFPRGLNDDLDERQERPEKYYWFEHGERNSIFNAARHGVSLKGCRMFLNCGVPCADCARAIIQVGIVEVIMPQFESVTTAAGNKQKWTDSAKRSLQMFKEAGVIVRLYESAE